MFSNLIFRNSRRSRKENGLFFSALVISIVAFYIILSLSHQDVMIFLKKMESDAVSRLFLIVPVFYIVTLGILFFLIYFACKYQLQRRNHEFGVYLMLGMRRSRLFFMLLAEDLVSSVLALAVGLPIAIFLSELISLITSKLVGLGIIGHQFSFSSSAFLFTIIGFLVVKSTAFLILSGSISRREIDSLLRETSCKNKKQKPQVVYILSAICGTFLLISAYTLAICGIAWQTPKGMLITLLFGILGTILLFYGMRTWIALFVHIGTRKKPLHVFNFRQIQENVMLQSTPMAISSLLILAALCCFGAGIGISNTSKQLDTHVFDYTFALEHIPVQGEPSNSYHLFSDTKNILSENHLEDQFSTLSSMRIGYPRVSESHEGVFVMDTVIDAIKSFPQSEERDRLLNNLSFVDYPHLVCLSDYNQLRELNGQPPLQLNADEAAVYMTPYFARDDKISILNQSLMLSPETELAGQPLYLTGEVESLNLVTDRSIALTFSLILPDEQFFYFTQGDYDVYVNGILSEDSTADSSLLQVYASLNEQLDMITVKHPEFRYESYLQNMGRQLFYMVSASYITSYLAIIFLIVANTIMGVQFLMSQRKNGQRYQTLIRLGATYETLCKSARTQINWFMGLPVFIAAISSLFGVKALFVGLLSSETKGAQGQMLVISASIILLLCFIEYIYMRMVKHSSDYYLLTLLEPRRQE